MQNILSLKKEQLLDKLGEKEILISDLENKINDCKNKIKELEIACNKEKENNNNLFLEINNEKTKNLEYKDTIKQLKQEIDKLKQPNMFENNKIDLLNKQLEKANNDLNKERTKNIELNEIIKRQEQSIKDLTKDKNELNSIINTKENNLRKKSQELNEEKNKINQEKINLQNQIRQNEIYRKEYENKMKIIDESSDKSHLYEGKSSEEFYDVIIKINSIKYLDEGWDISMNEKGQNNYNKYKDVNTIIRLGVIGNENKGKSTILHKISGLPLPTGYSIKTEGLSIKYPELEKYPNLKLVLLDSAGLETPVLNYGENDLNNKGYEFIEQSRDKLLTEVFLQNYIIKNSDLLLLVFGKLSFEEQKLLNKVKNDMKNLKRKEPLIVIHNLKEFERVNQVEDYIKNVLLRSSTFKLVEGTEINKDKEKRKWKYFYEPNSFPKIFHLIYAKEYSEAGEVYNKGTIDNIINKCNNITDKRPFDIIESIKETFSDVSESILEKPLKREDITDSDNKKIKLSNKEQQIKLKRCLIDELGFSNFLATGFEPKYDYYVNEDKLVINIEMPGDFKDVKVRTDSEGAYTIININGNKYNPIKEKNENEKIVYLGKYRDYGEFNIRIKIEGYNLKDNKPNVMKRNDKGITTIEYNLKTGDNIVSLDL